MYSMLVHTHSGLRWIILILLVSAVINNGMKWKSGKAFTDSDRKLNLFTMITAHLQLLLGIVLIFISPKIVMGQGEMGMVTKFFMSTHMLWMIVAVVLISIGNIRSKRLVGSEVKFKAAFIPYLLALLAILYAIPWPGRGVGGQWY